MKSFEDLVFMPEEGCSGDATFKAVAVFPNGYGVSVVSGNGTLTSSDKPYELAVIEYQEDGSYRLIYPSIFDCDVIPFLTADDVTSYMRIIQSLPMLF
jgi:hypothetical protein